VGTKYFIYQRETSSRFDKSFAPYIKTTYELSAKTQKSILNMAQEALFRYLCFDVIVDRHGMEFVIDINPYGSLPAYEQFPEPSLALANILCESCQDA
jgi:hypothetical protein